MNSFLERNVKNYYFVNIEGLKMEKIKLGVIGLGCRGTRLLEVSLACGDAVVTALCDTYADRVRRGAEIVREKQSESFSEYTDCDSFIADSNVDVVIIATSWDEHFRIAGKCMRAGKITATEVGGACELEECWQLVHTYEETKTPIMMLENCCYDRFELLVTSLARAGKLGEIVHCHGAYGHDLRKEVLGGRVNGHYRLDNYLKRNCDNYPTHELGPIAKLLNVNRGNRMVSLVSMSSKAAGLKEFALGDKNPDKTLIGRDFAQGDVVETLIKCANGETISLKLDTTLPRYYSREFTVNGTKGYCNQEANLIMFDGDPAMERYFEPRMTIENNLNCADKYKEYLPDIWRNITEEEQSLGHGGMDFLMLKEFFGAIKEGKDMPIDVYDAAAWACVTALSAQSIAEGGALQSVPDFTCGKWVKRQPKDVVEFGKKD